MVSTLSPCVGLNLSGCHRHGHQVVGPLHANRHFLFSAVFRRTLHLLHPEYRTSSRRRSRSLGLNHVDFQRGQKLPKIQDGEHVRLGLYFIGGTPCAQGRRQVCLLLAALTGLSIEGCDRNPSAPSAPSLSRCRGAALQRTSIGMRLKAVCVTSSVPCSKFAPRR